MAVKYNSLKYQRSPTQIPGNWRMKSLEINEVDVTEQFVQVDIYESLTSPVMTGRLTLVDTSNKLSKVPIIGEEEVVFSGDDETEKGAFEIKMRVFKVADREQLNIGVLKYVIHLISEEGYRDSFVRVSKAYDRVGYEEAVADFLGQDYLSSKKDYLFSQTRIRQCFVIPYWSPLSAAAWCASRAQDENTSYGGGNFLFFETLKGFNFLALDNLYDQTQNEVYSTIAVDPMRPSVEGKNVYDQRVPDDVMRFESYSVERSFDVLEAARSGMYANRSKVIDVGRKEQVEIDYNYVRDFDIGKHLGGGIAQRGFPICSTEHEALLYPDAHFRLVVQQKGNFTNEPDGGFQYADWVGPRLSQMQQSENFKIVGTLPGQTELVAGMQLYFDHPSIEDLSVNPDPNPDLRFSGNYLLTHLRRTFQKDRCHNTIEMIKDDVSLSYDDTEV